MFNPHPDAYQVPDNCPWGIAVFEYQTGKLIQANQYMRTIYSFEVGEDVSDFIMLSQGDRLDRIVHAIDPGKQWAGRVYPRSTRRGISSVEVVFERLESQSEVIWVYVLEHPLVKDEVRFSSRSELKMLRVLLDNTLEYVFFRDLDGGFIVANEAFRHAVAYEGRVPGMNNTIEDFASLKSAAWVRSLDTKMIESGRPVVNEVSLFMFKNGTKHWLQMTTVPVRSSEGVIIGSLSVARDISDLKRTESELRTAIAEAHDASRAKGDFLAAMSHEIRTPINGIIGASELCQETPLDIEQRGYLDTVIQCGSTLLNLVNDVLDFSKIEAGQLSLESLNFSPQNLVESVAGEFAQSARSSGVEIVVGLDPELPEYIQGDPTRVKQLFYNLIGNALKFTEKGDVVIRADVVSKDEDEVRIAFSVQDSGIGISKDRQEAIFNSFTQADMSTTRKYGGSGLGLAICRELVRLMDGTIRVDSEIGQGSRFVFEIGFPLAESPGAHAVPFNVELAGIRVLIVDDNHTNCELYQQMCSGWGYRSHVANDGLAGLSAMESAMRDGDPFRLVLLDQQMPGLTGLDLASLIQARPDLRGTQIILLSSSLNKQESDRAADMGLARALAKPVKRVTLQEVILETFGVGCAQPNALKRRRTSAPFKNDRALRVLLVEDNPINQDLARRRVQKLGHEVTLAEDGLEAVEKIKEDSFDCILMDIQMPRMDGFAATRAIRELESAESRRPQYIIAMTAHVMKGDKERCLDAGMDNYIPKPFRAEILKNVLDEAIAVAHEGGQGEESAYQGAAGTSFSERLQSMAEEDREDVILAAPVFLKACPKDIMRLQNAVTQRDFKEAFFVAHTLKSVSGIFGGQECVEFAVQVETASKEEDPAALEKSANELIDALRVLVNEVEFTVM